MFKFVRRALPVTLGAFSLVLLTLGILFTPAQVWGDETTAAAPPLNNPMDCSNCLGTCKATTNPSVSNCTLATATCVGGTHCPGPCGCDYEPLSRKCTCTV